MKKQVIVIFEGADRAGKDYTAKRFNKSTNFKYITFVRGFYSNELYDMKFNRHYADWAEVLKKFGTHFKVVLVLVTATNFQFKKMRQAYKIDQARFEAHFREFVSRANVYGVKITNPGDEVSHKRSLKYLIGRVTAIDKDGN